LKIFKAFFPFQYFILIIVVNNLLIKTPTIIRFAIIPLEHGPVAFIVRENYKKNAGIATRLPKNASLWISVNSISHNKFIYVDISAQSMHTGKTV